MENLSSSAPIAERIGKETAIIDWLLSRIQKPKSFVDQNKQYAAEVLTILLQSSGANRARFAALDGVDSLLQLLSPYRKKDPVKGTEEEEFVENLFDCLTCCLDDREGKENFLAAEGTELCLIMLREGKMSRPRALRLLDHALGGPDGAACCEQLVEAAGLKVTFNMFMKKVKLNLTNPSPTPYVILTRQPLPLSTTPKPQNTSSAFFPPCYGPSPLPPPRASASSPNSSRRITRNSTALWRSGGNSPPNYLS